MSNAMGAQEMHGDMELSEKPHQLSMEDFTPVTDMDVEAKLDEILLSLREVKVALAAFQNVAPAGIFKMLMSK